MLGLMEDREPGSPVPVRLAMTSFDDTRPVEDWLIDHLIEVYRMPRRAATALVRTRKVLPIFDGLDELDGTTTPGYDSPAGRVLQALNSYQHGRRKGDVVLTCRSTQYQSLEALQIWALDAAQIEIHPVSAASARQFLTQRVNDPTRWQPVQDLLLTDPAGHSHRDCPHPGG